MKFRKACGKAEKFRTELNCEQIVCSTWNNRSFRLREVWGGGSDCREVKYSGKEPPPTGNLKFRKACGNAEKFRTELDCEQVVCSTWNNRSFRLREVWGGGGSDCREVKYSGKEPPPPGNLKFRKACGKAEKFRKELDCEQIVCSTWNNRSFRLREVWGAAARIAEKLSIQVKSRRPQET